MNNKILLQEIFKKVRIRGFTESGADMSSIKTTDIDSAESLCRSLYDMGFDENIDFSYTRQKNNGRIEWKFTIIE